MTKEEKYINKIERDSQEFQLCGNGTFYSYILFSYGGLVKKGCGIKKFNAVSFFC